jgi:oligopeptide/dipeptide ABC transporter ATP-binding protein
VAALVEVTDLKKHFPVDTGVVNSLLGRRTVVKAVDGISFTLLAGEGLGLVGESGCGKTTTGRLLLKLTEPTEGSIRFEGAEVARLKGAELKRFRKRAQLVFQNPYEALNPRYSIGRSLAEPLVNVGVPRDEHDDRIAMAMQRVHLHDPSQYLDKFPHQLSGGQLQRVVLARALVLEPVFIVADEPVSMLDVSVRAGILNVMREARDTLGLGAVYISHDLALVRYVCERTIVMYLGQVMEDGPTEQLINAPAHPYTKALVSAVPTPDPFQPREPLPILEGRPDAAATLSGCPFRDRCPEAHARCAAERPRGITVDTGQTVYCHLYDT